MSFFDTNTRSQTLAPFIDGFIHDRLLQSTPHVDQTFLQFGDVTNSRLVHPLLHHTPDLIVNRIQIWAVRWPQIWCDEFWSITLKKLKSVSCSVCGCTVLLKDKEIRGHFTDRRQQFLRQQHFSVVFFVHLDARIHKDEISNTQLWHCYWFKIILLFFRIYHGSVAT